MPMPTWWRQINKKVFNPSALERGDWPVLRHVGRSSGKEYRTPLGALRTENGYAFLIVYGTGTDWLKNVLAAGEAVLEIDGQEVELISPRVVSVDEVFAKLTEDAKRPPKLLRISSCLDMDVVADRPRRASA